MDCVEVRKRLTALVDNELPVQEAERVHRHLKRCPECRLEAQGRRQIVEALNALPAIAAPAGFSQKTVRAFRAGLDRASLGQWWRQLSLAMRGAICAAALVGLLCGVALGSSLTTLVTESPANPYQTLYASKGMFP